METQREIDIINDIYNNRGNLPLLVKEVEENRYESAALLLASRGDKDAEWMLRVFGEDPSCVAGLLNLLAYHKISKERIVSYLGTIPKEKAAPIAALMAKKHGADPCWALQIISGTQFERESVEEYGSVEYLVF